MSRLSCVSLFALSSLAACGPAPAQPDDLNLQVQAIKSRPAPGFFFLSSLRSDFSTEKLAIEITPPMGSIKVLRIHVAGEGATLENVKIAFTDGTGLASDETFRFKRGSRSADLVIPDPRKKIAGVTFTHTLYIDPDEPQPEPETKKRRRRRDPPPLPRRSEIMLFGQQ